MSEDFEFEKVFGLESGPLSCQDVDAVLDQVWRPFPCYLSWLPGRKAEKKMKSDVLGMYNSACEWRHIALKMMERLGIKDQAGLESFLINHRLF